DMKLPGMLYGKVLRPPAFKAKRLSLDTRQAEAMPGVTVVRDGDFVGVAAPNPQLAERAIEAIQAEWETSPQPSSRELYTYLKTHPAEAQRPGGSEPETQGAIRDGLAAAAHTLQATYTIAYIAHAPLEPRAAVAQWENGKLTVWTGTQRP